MEPTAVACDRTPHPHRRGGTPLIARLIARLTAGSVLLGHGPEKITDPQGFIDVLHPIAGVAAPDVLGWLVSVAEPLAVPSPERQHPSNPTSRQGAERTNRPRSLTSQRPPACIR
ncbi:DoxX family protein [Streptomyces scabichelini]|uniref:DoxX family protein n=1 Tax=Streptomyces scabichelini TaxID=2711217 RepID=UPI003B96C2AF